MTAKNYGVPPKKGEPLTLMGKRDSDEWNSTYKIRTIVERAINHFKTNMCIVRHKIRNHATTKVDVFLAGIASQLTVIIAHRMSCLQYIRSLNPLIV